MFALQGIDEKITNLRSILKITTFSVSARNCEFFQQKTIIRGMLWLMTLPCRVFLLLNACASLLGE